MQAAEAFGLADTEAACTRDGHMKMPTSLQAPHSETHNSPALVCFFQQLPGKWPSASFILALHLQLTALVTWDHVHETKLFFIIYPHLLSQTLTSDMEDTHLLGYWNSQIFFHRVIWWWLTFQTSSQMCTQRQSGQNTWSQNHSWIQLETNQITKDQIGGISEIFSVSNQSTCKIETLCFCVLWRYKKINRTYISTMTVYRACAFGFQAFGWSTETGSRLLVVVITSSSTKAPS